MQQNIISSFYEEIGTTNGIACEQTERNLNTRNLKDVKVSDIGMINDKFEINCAGLSVLYMKKKLNWSPCTLRSETQLWDECFVL